jgi:hypothetical protein
MNVQERDDDLRDEMSELLQRMVNRGFEVDDIAAIVDYELAMYTMTEVES